MLGFSMTVYHTIQKRTCLETTVNNSSQVRQHAELARILFHEDVHRSVGYSDGDDDGLD